MANNPFNLFVGARRADLIHIRIVVKSFREDEKIDAASCRYLFPRYAKITKRCVKSTLGWVKRIEEDEVRGER